MFQIKVIYINGIYKVLEKMQGPTAQRESRQQQNKLCMDTGPPQPAFRDLPPEH
jgi:hypothetical protein